MLRTIAATTVMLALLALSAAAQSPLAGTQWRFVEVGGDGIPADTGARISFGQDGRASGSSGCNGFHGSYSNDGTALTFAALGWTKMLCPEPPKMRVEAAIGAALPKTSAYTMTDGTLHLVGADGALLARLETSAPR